MKEVSDFEARLLRILRCLMQRTTVEQVLALLVKPLKRPRCLSRPCVELVEDSLAKGVTEWLARSAWTNQRFLKSEAVLTGRLWDRHSTDTLRLTFSRNSLELLIWLTAENFAEPKSRTKIDEQTLTLGDRLLMLMAYAAIRGTLGGPQLLNQTGFAKHGIIGLMFPDNIGVTRYRKVEPDLEFWCRQDHCWVLESLQTALSRRWSRIEHNKRTTTNDRDLRTVGKFQTRVLNGLFAAADKYGRKDLCLFLVGAGRHLLSTMDSQSWFDSIDLRHLRMADRADVLQAALAFFHATERLQAWQEHALTIGYYDEDYHAGQLWKSEWERMQGDQLVQAAGRIIQHVNPLRTAR